ncbi:Calcineurin-like phosphoesterase [Popillia japonica]|uniref:Serine/threonine-protein phosphatase n=1 Tax=Popillia japonica TaxID=7064 RepID=A0AAW1N4H5_POPJA
METFNRMADRLDHEDEKSQINALLLHMGPKVTKFLESQQKGGESDFETYAETKEFLEKYFTGTTNLVYARARFNMRKQKEGETAQEYITSLISLAKACNYKKLENELIRDRDRFVIGIRTLEKAVEKILQAGRIKDEKDSAGHINLKIRNEKLEFKIDAAADETIVIKKTYEDKLKKYLKQKPTKAVLNGLPSPENPYVFNGDFVDRGKKGLEVLLLLLACMLVFPGGVFLNRGNHEDNIMNSRYGFIREVQSKYKHNAEKLLKMIEGVYRWLPLGTIVNNKVLIVHGGISDTTDLDLIKSLDRGKYTSLLRPPITDSNAPGAELIDKVEWKQVFDILWSDPQPCEGCIPNVLRGAGTYFGPDVTKRFLKRNKLMFIIRSHECKPDGYEIIHNNKVITIFSASNYYELGSNKGAYLKLVGPQLDTHFVQYTAATGKTKRLTFRQRVGLVESSAIRELRGHIISNREKLESEFRKTDQDQSGFINVSDWCRIMESATQLGLPWRLLRDKLVVLDAETGLVKYNTTFDKLNDSDIHTVQESNTVVETLYRNKSNLEAIFRIIDKDNSGYISLEEFSEACNLIREHIPNPITQEQLLDICKLMDMNKDGFVDLNEFLETFRMVDPEQRGNDGKSLHDEFNAEQNLVNTFAQICTFADQTPKTSPTAKNCETNEQNLVNTFAQICTFADQTPKTSPTAKNCETNRMWWSPGKKNGELDLLKKSSTNHNSSCGGRRGRRTKRLRRWGKCILKKTSQS